MHHPNEAPRPAVKDYDMDTLEYAEDEEEFLRFQGPAGTRVPDEVSDRPDFEDEMESEDRMEGDEEAPEDAIGTHQCLKRASVNMSET